jgi:hypothetical protein
MELDHVAEVRNYADLFNGTEACWLEVPQHNLTGERDVGRRVPLQIGNSTLNLTRSQNWAPGQTTYIYSPRSEDLTGGTLPHEELVLAGYPTGVTVPEPVEWDPSSWTNLLETGVFEPSWTPAADGDGMLWVELRLYRSDYEVERFTCALADDGSARLETGWSPEEMAATELFVARVHQGFTDHPEYGRLYVWSFQSMKFIDFEPLPSD